MGPEAFDYHLPPERIAQAPAARRGDSRLMVCTGEAPVHVRSRSLPEHLPPDALVVVNASRVVPARLHATRDDGRRFELLVADPSPAQGVGATVSAWVRGAKRLRPGDALHAGGLCLRYEGADPVDARARRFTVEHGRMLSVLHERGELPLPPYIARPQGPGPGDLERYQTVYARDDGSVAAPTAGLHLDEEMLARLDVVELLLHVGPGTFLPMDVTDVTEHRVGAERIELTSDAAARIEAARAAGRPIVAVGTTTTRALEGIAAAHGGRLPPTVGTTSLVITPGFRFSVVTHLLTNFHLPRSSLLMLVCALAGRSRVLSWYREAVRHDYRFYSYGDCMLVAREPDTPDPNEEPS
ncbi:tRNA preQ1(34) S-adenosylmethionine ribosyltransferase-isomerase QueA [Paraliomyxa miuraensis]|uniref:tRNA preQ1(34) S-adenosylmethionine ribosyltransferase-isomerase QueA n=1 Tax=Paraliomyxa miuraensis TaxID=376150 RepID=UPI002256F752|nr:tRNA preQ1(34) S-adenosylmethionine ribosyltransferase-isomerase QueA [Paraliomyxa miuraensis]MCX4244642.1 tRNA preQ1(34) S-adenosylmethionine ribosyltransferase-isomerase QueA [Paraliomyxa miuraensis]